MGIIVGGILHDAHGDYYEQLVALGWYKQQHAGRRLVLFFAGHSRRRELAARLTCAAVSGRSRLGSRPSVPAPTLAPDSGITP
jgi:hypothetical protein